MLRNVSIKLAKAHSRSIEVLDIQMWKHFDNIGLYSHIQGFVWKELATKNGKRKLICDITSTGPRKSIRVQLYGTVKNPQLS